MHPGGRLKKLASINEGVKFIKQVLVHPWDWLKRKTKSMKQVSPRPRDKLEKTTNKLKHPRNRMKNREGQIGR